MGSLSTTNVLASHLTSPKPNRNSEKPADLNIRNVVLGDILFRTWYPSFYPEEIVGRLLDRLYVCQWCFRYSKELMPYLAHTVRTFALILSLYVDDVQKLCSGKQVAPPGRLVYKRDVHAIHEVNGEEQRVSPRPFQFS